MTHRGWQRRSLQWQRLGVDRWTGGGRTTRADEGGGGERGEWQPAGGVCRVDKYYVESVVCALLASLVVSGFVICDDTVFFFFTAVRNRAFGLFFGQIVDLFSRLLVLFMTPLMEGATLNNLVRIWRYLLFLRDYFYHTI